MTKKILLILFFGFILNSLISFFYINNFNHYEKINTDGENRHQLIKGMNENHWKSAFTLMKILKMVKISLKVVLYIIKIIFNLLLT